MAEKGSIQKVYLVAMNQYYATVLLHLQVVKYFMEENHELNCTNQGISSVLIIHWVFACQRTAGKQSTTYKHSFQMKWQSFFFLNIHLSFRYGNLGHDSCMKTFCCKGHVFLY